MHRKRLKSHLEVHLGLRSEPVLNRRMEILKRKRILRNASSLLGEKAIKDQGVLHSFGDCRGLKAEEPSRDPGDRRSGTRAASILRLPTKNVPPSDFCHSEWRWNYATFPPR